MNRHYARVLLPAFILAVSVAAVPACAQSTSPWSGTIGLEAITLTNFGSYFSLPVGVELSGDYRVADLGAGFSVSAGGSAGWWLESFRDTFNFHPELIPVMIPVTSSVGLRWEPLPSLALEVNAVVGFVIEWAPGAPPSLLLYLSPGLDARWFFAQRAGMAMRFAWAWVGADPIWDGPAIKLGPIFR
jgi:hypothetical protein